MPPMRTCEADRKCDLSQNGTRPQRHSATWLRRQYGHRRAEGIPPQLTSTRLQWLVVSDVRHRTDRPRISAKDVMALPLTMCQAKGLERHRFDGYEALAEERSFPMTDFSRLRDAMVDRQIAARGMSSKSVLGHSQVVRQLIRDYLAPQGVIYMSGAALTDTQEPSGGQASTTIAPRRKSQRARPPSSPKPAPRKRG